MTDKTLGRIIRVLRRSVSEIILFDAVALVSTSVHFAQADIPDAANAQPWQVGQTFALPPWRLAALNRFFGDVHRMMNKNFVGKEMSESIVVAVVRRVVTP